jgi:hypothetical protein
VYVLNHKIQVGPDLKFVPHETSTAGVLDAAGERVEHEFSLTEAKDDESESAPGVM